MTPTPSARSEGDGHCLLLSFAWKHDNGDLLLVVKGDVACALIIQINKSGKLARDFQY